MLSRAMMGTLVGATGTVGIMGGGVYKIYTSLNPATPIQKPSVTASKDIEDGDKYRTAMRQYVFMDESKYSFTFTPTSNSCDVRYCKTNPKESNGKQHDIGVDSKNKVVFYRFEGEMVNINILEKFKKTDAQNKALINEIDEFLNETEKSEPWAIVGIINELSVYTDTRNYLFENFNQKAENHPPTNPNCSSITYCKTTWDGKYLFQSNNKNVFWHDISNEETIIYVNESLKPTDNDGVKKFIGEIDQFLNKKK